MSKYLDVSLELAKLFLFGAVVTHGPSSRVTSSVVMSLEFVVVICKLPDELFVVATRLLLPLVIASVSLFLILPRTAFDDDDDELRTSVPTDPITSASDDPMTLPAPSIEFVLFLTDD